MREITIRERKIGTSHPPLIVAELSANHNGSLDSALKLVEAAHEAGIHAIKLQTYTPDTITLDIKDGDFLITDETSLWRGKTLYDLYREAYTPWDWHIPIFERCKELGMLAFSTPFDETAVDFLEGLDVLCYKIGSPEIVDIPLIRKVGATGKPLILSTGGATRVEISEAVSAAKSVGCRDIILLKCTMSYPSQPDDANLRTIPDMISTFDVPVGISDHSLGIGVAIASVAFGACVIEKHLTYDRREGGVDSAFSMEPAEFKLLVGESYRAWRGLGHVHYGPLPSEKVSYSHRPSLYFIEDIPLGTVIQEAHISSLRPNKGLPPKEIDQVIGRKLLFGVKKGMPVSWECFS
ncbi:MAG: pseudaminic acid synthase [Parachlamydiaceae bacterium]